MDTLVLGIGNLLMGDEGVGVHTIRHLEATGGVDAADLMDGGTGGFHLLGHLQAYQRVILIDAAANGHPAGTITELRPKFSSDYPNTLTAHDIGLKDLLDAMYLLGEGPDMTLIAVSVGDLGEVTTELSPEIAAVLPRIAEAVRRLVAAPA